MTAYEQRSARNQVSAALLIGSFVMESGKGAGLVLDFVDTSEDPVRDLCELALELAQAVANVALAQAKTNLAGAKDTHV